MGRGRSRGEHVAVLKRRFADDVLSGAKTVECRLTRTRREPWGRIEAGDVVHIKQSSGPYRAVCTVSFVEQLECASFADLRRAFSRHRRALGGDRAMLDAFLADRRAARFAVFVGIERVRPTSTGPSIAPLHGRAWLCLGAANRVRRLAS